MEPLDDVVLLTDEPQGPILHVRWMARREPHPRRLLRHPLQKVAESPPALPPRIDRLPEQRYVPRAGADQAPHLREDVLHGPAYHPAPHGRHHAVAAFVVAARHHGYEGRVVAFRSR